MGMLQKTEMVTKKAIELLYNGVCTVCEQQKVLKPNKTTGFEEVIVLEDVPCHLSFERVTNAVSSNNASATAISLQAKLFIAPEINIKPGSKLVITQKGATKTFKNSGVSAVYGSHQEIMLELEDRWS